jgi:hypothetical protein
MEINKDEIIDEIISIEPKFKDDRDKLENMLDDIILSKPNVEISSAFKNELKERLLTSIKVKTYNSKKFKINYFKNIASFILWWVATFSMIWFLWINLNFDEVWDTLETDLVIEEIAVDEPIKTKMASPSLMMMESEPLIDDNNWSIDLMYEEIEKYLIEIGLNPEQIEKIINIIKKYN